MQTRRGMLGMAAAALLAPSAFAQAGGEDARDLLDRAIKRMGGERALSQVRALHWTGQARVTIPGRTPLVLVVDTEVEPFVRAASKSWSFAQGPQSTRTMTIEAAGGWVERGGTRTPLPPAQAAHERAQYALFGLMLLAPLREPGVTLTPLPPRNGLEGFRVAHPQAPVTDLWFDADARLAEAANSVPDPEGRGMVAQRIVFTDQLKDAHIRWPREMTIAQDGKPYFDLSLETFQVERG